MLCLHNATFYSAQNDVCVQIKQQAHMDLSLSISVDSRESEEADTGIKQTLRQAAWDLSLRGLKIAAKWCVSVCLFMFTAQEECRHVMRCIVYCGVFYREIGRASGGERGCKG